MPSERWARVSLLLDELLELDPPLRETRLDALREEDRELADEIARLLTLDEARPDFLAQPVVDASLFAPQPGGMIGPYRLDRLLGEGGMGQVWLALRADGLYERRVALKLLRPGLTDAGLRGRFTRERQILARLAHAHIARLLDAGVSADGQPYLALEFVEGEPITTYAFKHRLPLAERLRLFLQVCDAVTHAHANLVVHRDLKPSNILVTPAGDVRLLDFGIAKLLDAPSADSPSAEITRTGARAFTLHYAAPEQVRGQPVTTMTDVYTLGVVLYELLTGRKPYRLRRPTDAGWEEAILETEPTRPSAAAQRREGETPAPDPQLARALAGDLDNIVLKALAKLPEQRYPSVEAMGQDLRRYLDGRPVSARPQSMLYRAGKYARRHRVALGVATLVIAVLLASLGIVSWQARQALAEAARAQAFQDFVVALFEGTGASGAPVDVNQLLDAGVRRAEIELADQPQDRVELLGLIAKLHNVLGDYREALAVLDLQQPMFATLEQTPPSLRLDAAIQRGRALGELGQARQCVAAMRPQRALADQAAVASPLAAAAFLSELGRCHHAQGEGTEARALYERALALRAARPDSGSAEAESLADLAMLEADAGDTRAAVTGMRAALTRLREADGERSDLGIEIWRDLGRLYRDLGDTGAAEAALLQAQSLTLALHGPAHPKTWGVLRLLGAAYVDAGRLAEAERMIRDVHDSNSARLGPDHVELAGTWNSLGILALERGKLAEAERALRRSVEISRAASSLSRLPGTLFNLAMALHAAGKHAQAREALEECLRLRRQHYGEQHPLVGHTLRLLGEVRAAQGDTDGGRALIEQAIAMMRAGDGDTHPRTGSAELALARLLLRSGDVARAQGLINEVILRFPPSGSERRKLVWLARALAAHAQCVPDRPGALATLDALIKEVAAARPEGGSLGRDIAALRAGCGAVAERRSDPQRARRG